MDEWSDVWSERVSQSRRLRRESQNVREGKGRKLNCRRTLELFQAELQQEACIFGQRCIQLPRLGILRVLQQEVRRYTTATVASMCTTNVGGAERRRSFACRLEVAEVDDLPGGMATSG